MTALSHHDEYHLMLKLLRETRHEQAVTQTDLAQRLETTQAFISKVERGDRRLDAIELIELVEALGVSADAWMKKFLQHRKAIHGKHGVKRKISV